MRTGSGVGSRALLSWSPPRTAGGPQSAASSSPVPTQMKEVEELGMGGQRASRNEANSKRPGTALPSTHPLPTLGLPLVLFERKKKREEVISRVHSWGGCWIPVVPMEIGGKKKTYDRSN